MKELRNSLLLLLTYVIGLLGISQIRYLETNYINFDEVFFVLFALAATIGIFLPSFFRPSIYINLFVWAVIYLLIWLFYWQYLEDQLTTFVLGLQFILIELAAGLSHFVGLHLDEVEFLLNELSVYSYPNRMLNLNTAHDRINTEFMRSSRFNHPLTILAVQLKSVGDVESWSIAKSLQRDLLKLFAIAKTGQIISKLARQTDLIIHENNERFLIVCPETDKAHSALLAERICKVVQEEMESDLAWGCASFPEESYSFNDLLELAVQRIEKRSPSPTNERTVSNSLTK